MGALRSCARVAISSPCNRAAASTVTFVCSGTSSAMLALANWLNFCSASSSFVFSSVSRFSMNSRSLFAVVFDT